MSASDRGEAVLARDLTIERTTVENTMIVFSTEMDNVASDGRGDHSPFTRALLEVIATPGIEVGVMFRIVRTRVMELTSRQMPMEQITLGTKQVFLAGSPQAGPRRS